ncbi:MAG: hypothetical protein ACRDYU_02610 [Actinomycetes bacterium]
MTEPTAPSSDRPDGTVEGPGRTESPEPAGSGHVAPRGLSGAWRAWLIAVLVNVVIWGVASVSTGELIYFWPIWVAGPWGAVRLASALSSRRGR